MSIILMICRIPTRYQDKRTQKKQYNRNYLSPNLHLVVGEHSKTVATNLRKGGQFSPTHSYSLRIINITLYQITQSMGRTWYLVRISF